MSRQAIKIVEPILTHRLMARHGILVPVIEVRVLMSQRDAAARQIRRVNAAFVRETYIKERWVRRDPEMHGVQDMTNDVRTPNTAQVSSDTPVTRRREHGDDTAVQQGVNQNIVVMVSVPPYK